MYPRRVGSRGERLPRFTGAVDALIVGIIIQTIRKSLVASGAQLGYVFRSRRWRGGAQIHKRLRVRRTRKNCEGTSRQHHFQPDYFRKTGPEIEIWKSYKKNRCMAVIHINNLTFAAIISRTQ